MNSSKNIETLKSIDNCLSSDVYIGITESKALLNNIQTKTSSLTDIENNITISKNTGAIDTNTVRITLANEHITSNNINCDITPQTLSNLQVQSNSSNLATETSSNNLNTVLNDNINYQNGFNVHQMNCILRKVQPLFFLYLPLFVKQI